MHGPPTEERISPLKFQRFFSEPFEIWFPKICLHLSDTLTQMLDVNKKKNKDYSANN